MDSVLDNINSVGYDHGILFIFYIVFFKSLAFCRHILTNLWGQQYDVLENPSKSTQKK